MRNVISLLALCMLPTPATAQSMNVRAIVETVMGGVCAPYARDGDIAGAVRAAEASGYVVVPERSALLLDRDPPAGTAELYRRHHGTVMLDLSGDRGTCGVGIHEGGPTNMGPAAEPFMRALGLEPVVDVRERQATTDILVWRGGTTQLVIARSSRFSPGSELTLSFVVPGR